MENTFESWWSSVDALARFLDGVLHSFLSTAARSCSSNRWMSLWMCFQLLGALEDPFDLLDAVLGFGELFCQVTTNLIQGPTRSDRLLWIGRRVQLWALKGPKSSFLITWKRDISMLFIQTILFQLANCAENGSRSLAAVQGTGLFRAIQGARSHICWTHSASFGDGLEDTLPAFPSQFHLDAVGVPPGSHGFLSRLPGHAPIQPTRFR